ncbi:hypothetical protein L345_14973, partial [Ophiophagus hannah]
MAEGTAPDVHSASEAEEVLEDVEEPLHQEEEEIPDVQQPVVRPKTLDGHQVSLMIDIMAEGMDVDAVGQIEFAQKEEEDHEEDTQYENVGMMFHGVWLLWTSMDSFYGQLWSLGLAPMDSYGTWIQGRRLLKSGNVSNEVTSMTPIRGDIGHVEIDKILNSWRCRHAIQYLVRWKGYTDSEASWTRLDKKISQYKS